MTYELVICKIQFLRKFLQKIKNVNIIVLENLLLCKAISFFKIDLLAKSSYFKFISFDTLEDMILFSPQKLLSILSI
jgi:hypothetical protein